MSDPTLSEFMFIPKGLTQVSCDLFSYAVTDNALNPST